MAKAVAMVFGQCRHVGCLGAAEQAQLAQVIPGGGLVAGVDGVAGERNQWHRVSRLGFMRRLQLGDASVGLAGAQIDDGEVDVGCGFLRAQPLRLLEGGDGRRIPLLCREAASVFVVKAG